MTTTQHEEYQPFGPMLSILSVVWIDRFRLAVNRLTGTELIKMIGFFELCSPLLE
jgi:hypothetical protein